MENEAVDLLNEYDIAAWLCDLREAIDHNGC
jgi:hypothetical protein